MKKLLRILLILPILAFAQDEDPCYSINDYKLLTELNNPQIEINLVSGWNMIGYPCTQEVIVSDAFSSIVNDISIVKDNNGNVYMPEFEFNGIGFLEGGQGYQIKMTDFVLGFTFCQSIQFPTIEGCTDCEAVNFSKLATTDDGSCSYDSDGDGVVDFLEVVGCQDATACNYNELATDSGECTYAQDGYDCEGNITAEIGDMIEGGYLFYLHESGTKGLVAAMDDLGIYEYGCSNEDFNDASSQVMLSGLQNTIDLLGCSTMYGESSGSSACYEYVGSEYTDWFLPSIEELVLIYNNIGQGSVIGNIGGFENNIYLSSTNNLSSQFAESFRLDFSNGSQVIYQNHISSVVRPIRAFGDWTVGCIEETACNYSSGIEIQNSEICDYFVQVGDTFGGGIVFYVDESCQHGLIASVEELSEGAYYGEFGGFGYEWGCYAIEVNGADDVHIGTGLQNSLDINNQSCIPYSNSEYINAAEAALGYIYEGFDDWYLPSIDELNLLNYVFELNGKHWSSSEKSPHSAHTVGVSGLLGDSKFYTHQVRPIRSF